METVSLIVPVYCLEKELGRCLDSLLRQTYRALEILLVDDGSTDGSLSVCRRFAETDDRMRVLHHENRGVSYTRNRGLSCATGTYVMFVDGDDEVTPDMVERYASAAASTGADVVIGGLRYIEGGIETDKIPSATGVFEGKAFWELVCRDTTGVYGYVPNKLYRRELLEAHEVRFPEAMAAQEDFAFALSAYGAAKTLCLTDCCGYRYYRVPGKRSAPLPDLLENQRKLYALAARNGVSAQGLSCVGRRVAGHVYGILFSARDEETVRALGELPGLREQLACATGLPAESRRILSRFRREKYRAILRYFRRRRRLKRALGREGGPS